MATIDEEIGTDIFLKSDMQVAASGSLDVITGLENLRLRLFHRLITSPGSLAHRPSYGVGIKDYQNAPGSLSIFQKLANRIQEQFAEDPMVSSVLGVSIQNNDTNPALIVIVVRVEVIGYQETEMKFTPFEAGV